MLSVLAEAGITAIDALKIDVEGAEDIVLAPFLRDAPQSLLPRLILIEDTRGFWGLDLFALLARRGYTEAGAQPPERGAAAWLSDMADTTATHSAFDRARLARVADWLAVGVAVAMPWSISASQILTAALAAGADPHAGRGRGAPRTAQRGRRAAGAALAAGARRNAVGERAVGRTLCRA